jgi:K+-sensing histidine kinase KdpD
MTTWVQQDKPSLTAVADECLDDTYPAARIVKQAAHDLTQPVAAIQVLASAAVAELQAPERLRRCLEQIAEEANWLGKVIHDMLAEAAITQGSDLVDIAALVRDAVNSERLTYGGCITLRQQGQEPRYVQAVSARLRRALANVLANATRAAGKDGCVQVTDRIDGSTEYIEIMDDGPGFGYIEPAHGIGLQITQQNLAECGGKIETERLISGHTLVRLLLPVMCDSPAGGQ